MNATATFYFLFFSFDSLQPLQLLQVLNDVFAEINPQVIIVCYCFLSRFVGVISIF